MEEASTQEAPSETAEETVLQRAVRLAGGQAPLGRKATAFHPRGKKLTQAMIWKWLNRPPKDGLVPTAEWVIPIELALEGQMKRGELRGDLYPPEQLYFDPQPLKAA